MPTVKLKVKITEKNVKVDNRKVAIHIATCNDLPDFLIASHELGKLLDQVSSEIGVAYEMENWGAIVLHATKNIYDYDSKTNDVTFSIRYLMDTEEDD